jgi:uncharacterized membrane protein
VPRWLIVLLVVVALLVILVAVFITIGVLATPQGGSEDLITFPTW